MATVTSCKILSLLIIITSSVDDFEEDSTAPSLSLENNDILLGGYLLNFTYFNEKLSATDGFEGFTPRFTALGKLRSLDLY
jgi:hypothetical protein